MDYGKAVYSAGPFQPRSKYDDTVKDHLYLSYEQNEELTKNLQLERIFTKYEKQPRLKSMMDFKNTLVKVCKTNRVAQRPLLLAVAKMDEMIRYMRGQGDSMGLLYPAEAPFKSLLGPREVQDHLAYTSANPFPLPVVLDPLTGTTSMTDADRKIVMDNMAVNITALNSYQAGVKSGVLGLYNNSAAFTLNMKNLVNFYL